MSDIIENNSEELEDDENYITLTNDEGEDVSFEVIGTVEYEERLFAVLLPFDDEEEGLVILEIVESEEEGFDDFLAVEDEELLEAVYTEFKKNYEGDYELE